jgi:tetratricopeptide (TPR) repeat protein
LLVLAVSAAADDRVAAGWDHFYNLEYGEAIEAFQAAIASAPDVPEHYNYLAQAILYKELYRLGALESELLTGDNHFIRTEKIRPDPVEATRFQAAVEKAIALAEARLKHDPEDNESLYALGSACGLRTNYEFLVQKNWRRALRYGSLARRYHNRAASRNPGHYDALLSQGVYDYVIGSLPWHTRLLSFLAGHKGDKTRGIRAIIEVAEKGRLNRVDAQVMLAVIYRREKQPAYAIRVLEPLIRAYPRNYLFRLEQAHMYSDLGNKEEALRILREVERLALGGAPEYARIPLAKVYYEMGNMQFWYGDLEEALANLRRVTREPDPGLHTGALAWMRQGQILDLMGRRSEAKEAYSRAMQFAPQTAAAEESRRYLSAPYKRKA